MPMNIVSAQVYTMKINSLLLANCKRIGGGKNLHLASCFHFARLTPVFLLSLIVLTSGCFSATADDDLRPYYEESCHLMEVGHDSLCRFDDKIQSLTRANAISQSDLLYDEILDNIEEAYKYYHQGLHILVDTTWADTLHYNF